MCVMGDDNLSWLKSYKDKEAFNDILKTTFNMESHPNKGEDGVFFLQNRVIKTPERSYFQTPVARSISKIFWVERAKGLGPYG